MLHSNTLGWISVEIIQNSLSHALQLKLMQYFTFLAMQAEWLQGWRWQRKTDVSRQLQDGFVWNFVRTFTVPLFHQKFQSTQCLAERRFVCVWMLWSWGGGRRKRLSIWDCVNVNKLFTVCFQLCVCLHVCSSEKHWRENCSEGEDEEEDGGFILSLSPFLCPPAATVLNPLPPHCDEGWWLWNYCEAPRCLSVRLFDYWDWWVFSSPESCYPAVTGVRKDGQNTHTRV